MAAGVLGFVALGIGIPIVVSGTDRLELQSASLVAATRDRFAISAPLSLSGVPGVVVERGMLALSDKHYNRPITGEAEAALLASGGARLVLEGATITIDPGAAITTELPAAPLAKALAELSFETLALRRSTLVFKSGGTRTTIGDVSAEIVPKRRTAISARGSISVRGHKLALDALLGLPGDSRRSAGAVRQQSLKLSVKGALVDASFDGAVDFAEGGALRGSGEIAMRNVRDAARAAGLGWPQGPGLANFKVKGSVTWSQGDLAFQKAQMLMDGNEATGTLSISASGERPVIGGTIALQTLDLSGYVADWRRDASRAASFIDDLMGPGPLSLPLVRHLDADIRISANRVRTGAVELGQSAATLSLRNGRLQADVAEVAIGDALANGQITVDVNGPGPRYSVRGKLVGFDLSRLVPDGPGAVSVRGKGDITSDVTATGETIADLLRTMSGKISVAVPAGGRVGLDLRSMMVAAQKQPFSGWGNTRGVTTVDNLQGRLLVNEGVVYTEMFSAALGDALLTATGGGNLRNGQLDLRLSMASRGAADKAGLPPPVDALVLRGPWHEPLVRGERSIPVADQQK